MAKQTKAPRRTGLFAILVAVVPLSVYWYQIRPPMNTESMLDASVSIKTISHVRIDAVGDSVWEPAVGSGFLVSKRNCEVWTNHHVVANAAIIEIHPRRWSATSGIPAKVFNSSPRSDIAVLRMQSCDGLSEARLGDSDTLHSGDEVYAVGNPLGLNPDSISRGILSHTKRIANGGIGYLQTDATINRGNSGGALFNDSGKVIGMNTAVVFNQQGKSTGIGYALPINLVKQEATSLSNGPPSWGNAGLSGLITELSIDEAAVFHVPDGHAALVLTEMPEESPIADKLIAHDVIYQLDDIPVVSANQAIRLINARRPGETLTIHFIRDGSARSTDITLADGWRDKEAPSAEHYDGFLGLALEMWTEEDPIKGEYQHPVITQVKSLSPAHMAYIASSQKTIVSTGGLVFPVQLDVKTITGAVHKGTYHPIDSIEILDTLAATASAGQDPLLLEIETWARVSPMNLEEPLLRQATQFHKVLPARTVAEQPPAIAETSRTHTEPGEHQTTNVAQIDSIATR